jgi:hypothetical protein
MDRNPTSALLRMLDSASSIDAFIDAHEADLAVMPFHERVAALAQEKKLTVAQIIQQAMMNESYCYQLFKGTRKPSRDKILQLAFGMALNLEQTNGLLRAAQKSELYCRNKRDAVIMFGLNNRKSILEIEEILLDKGYGLLVDPDAP